MARSTSEPSPEQTAKLNRQRLAKQDGREAMEEAARDAIAVRKNMARLRGLRLAREAEEQAPSEVKGNRTKQT
jgi:hypothetical protein